MFQRYTWPNESANGRHCLSVRFEFKCCPLHGIGPHVFARRCRAGVASVACAAPAGRKDIKVLAPVTFVVGCFAPVTLVVVGGRCFDVLGNAMHRRIRFWSGLTRMTLAEVSARVCMAAGWCSCHYCVEACHYRSWSRGEAARGRGC